MPVVVAVLRRKRVDRHITIVQDQQTPTPALSFLSTVVLRLAFNFFFFFCVSLREMTRWAKQRRPA